MKLFSLTAARKCQNCINVCETNIIIRDNTGFPKIDFARGECTFCQKCIQACEQPLFTIAQNSSKQQSASLPWPISININEQCLALNNIYCQSCRDECEAEAITFSHHLSSTPSSIPQPRINNADCNQCGACISTCPQDAIGVNFSAKY